MIIVIIDLFEGFSSLEHTLQGCGLRDSAHAKKRCSPIFAVYSPLPASLEHLRILIPCTIVHVFECVI